MKLVLEYEKANPCDKGPDTIYRTIEIKGLTRKERKKKNPRKVMDILVELKAALRNESWTVRAETYSLLKNWL